MAKTLVDILTAARAQIKEIMPDDLEEMRDDTQLLIVDVREENEFKSGHIDGSVHIPRGILEGAADPAYRTPHPELSKARKRPVVLVCATGGRSAMATVTLQEMGFEQVFNLAGGLKLWEAEDYPLTTD